MSTLVHTGRPVQGHPRGFRSPPCRSGPDRQDYFSNDAAWDFRRGKDRSAGRGRSGGKTGQVQTVALDRLGEAMRRDFLLRLPSYPTLSSSRDKIGRRDNLREPAFPEYREKAVTVWPSKNPAQFQDWSRISALPESRRTRFGRNLTGRAYCPCPPWRFVPSAGGTGSAG